MIPVLWLCGPPGVGKTTVAWEIYSRLKRDGVAAAYVDIDQLGICYPEPSDDPGRHRMKARNLDAVAAGFQAAGARCLIVSGVLDPAHGVRPGQVPRTALTVCRLRAGREELRRRFTGRGGSADQIEDVLREADALDASDFADVTVDTDGLAPAEVARLVSERIGTWPGPSEEPVPELPQVTFDGDPVMWLCGTTAVGKSTAGFELFMRALRAGRTAAYVDLGQIGFRAPVPSDDPDDHQLRARNLASLWRTYRAAGAQVLVVTGPVRDETTIKTYAEALPGARLTLCRLHAGREELTRRIVRRGQGSDWSQPGDPLRGQPTARLLQLADEAVATATALERAGIGEVHIPTDGRTSGQVVDAILARTGWLGPRP
ncbi:AAA family ATPase [Nonomuraea sp. FMUSA5-5]|uniref:AAA family ATPase n=1 Tax=Nonomuraea composti TaxID=2720023 RepID=A0ABX1BE97_9ACTN|nr:AAA family ATPase [Nonomuraea sp. FMUSA5-5]